MAETADETRERFRAAFGRAPEVLVRAPGRVNLIGEHTDTSEGLVLPCAIDRGTWVAAARADGDRVRAVSREEAAPCAFAAGAEVRAGDWGDYLRGVAAALRERGWTPGGLALAVASDVPRGAGLSSSAALAVAVATAVDALFGLGLGARARADAAHAAETRFVGVPCGVMDPYASALGRAGHALRIDCRSLGVRAVALPPGAALLVAHSGVERRLADGRYAARREEVRAALEAARALRPEARALRDFAPADLPALERVLEGAPLRRLRHVVRENARVDAACEALRAGDLPAAGALLREGHASLRDDFAVSVPELDLLCALGDAAPGVHGSRLTGAGFGGCTLHLVDADAAESARETLATGFERRTGRRPPLWVVRPADGAAVVA